MRRFAIISVLLSVIALAAVACGDGNDDGADGGEATGGTPADSGFVVQAVSQDVAIGPTRFVVALFDQEANLILNADADFRFILTTEDGQETMKAELPAVYTALKSNFVHEHPDGERHVHGGEEVGLYVANVEFDTVGVWAVEVQATVDATELGSARALFQVAEETASPNIGAAAPKTQQLTLADVDDLAEIDTSAEPDPEMHGLTIAEAVENGRATVITFTTPAFCVSRICGPVKSEVVDPLFEQFGGQVDFVHVEPWDLEQARAGALVPVEAMADWSLTTEPWVFVVDDAGLIAARFEGVLSIEELREAIEDVLA